MLYLQRKVFRTNTINAQYVARYVQSTNVWKPYHCWSSVMYNKTALYATKFEENDKNVVYILKHNIKKGSR